MTRKSNLPMKRRTIAVVSLIALITLAGCLSMTAETTINPEGDVAEMNVEMEVEDTMTWEMLEMGAEEEGYDSLEEYFASDMDLDDMDAEDVDVSVDDDAQTVSVSVSDAPIDEMDGMETDVDEDAGEVTYTETELAQDDELQQEAEFGEPEVDMTYAVVMPGEILETNGEEVDDYEVQWGEEEIAEHDELTVTSEQTGNEEATADDDGAGFGIFAGAGALAVLLSIAVARRRL